MGKRKQRKRARKKEKNKPSKIKSWLRKIFSLNTKRVIIILAIWVLSVIAHNVINLVYDIDEQIFFVISGMILPVYLLISIIFFTRSNKKRE